MYENTRDDPTLLMFTVSSAKNWLKCLLLISLAALVNISTTSVLAIFMMCSLSVGLAMQGLLKDLADGVMLLLLCPFKVGGLVETQSITRRCMKLLFSKLFYIVLTTKL